MRTQCRRKCCQQSTDDGRVFIALGVQLRTQRGGRGAATNLLSNHTCSTLYTRYVTDSHSSAPPVQSNVTYGVIKEMHIVLYCTAARRADPSAAAATSTECC